VKAEDVPGDLGGLWQEGILESSLIAAGGRAFKQVAAYSVAAYMALLDGWYVLRFRRIVIEKTTDKAFETGSGVVSHGSPAEANGGEMRRVLCSVRSGNHAKTKIFCRAAKQSKSSSVNAAAARIKTTIQKR